jgi:hypothetical protein
MLTRFTGTPENKAALVTGVPKGRLGLSEELADAIVFVECVAGCHRPSRAARSRASGFVP